jgi:glycosyltransferase involved in cell wall biosynthesis
MRASAELSRALQSFFRAHDPVMVTVGLLEPEYDLSRQIAAVPLLRKALPGAGLVIIGSGSLHTRLQREVDAAGAADILLCGDVPHAETVAAIGAASVFLRTTLYDGDSISVREALSLGTPVVATDTGMRPDGVHLVPVEGVQALVSAIQDVLAGPRHHHDEGESADHIATVLELYQSMLT